MPRRYNAFCGLYHILAGVLRRGWACTVLLYGFIVCDLGIRIEFLLCSGKGLSAGEPADFSHALLNDFRFASLNGKIALEKCHFFFLWITVLSNEIAGVSGVLSSLVLRVISSRFMGVSLCFS